MLAAVLKDFNQLVLEDVPIPEPGPGEVVVRIKSCGICATDYKAIKGIRKNVEFPLIPGHEPAGTISAVGSYVTNVKEGDDVVMSPSGFCGLCRNCRMGKTHYCEHSYSTGGDGSEVRPGSFAEYTRTGANVVFPKPPELSFDAGCQAEPVSGAWKGLIHYSEMHVGDDVVVIGTGGIGMYCLMVARAAGAGRLIAVDTSDYALKNAKILGATHIINPKNCDAKSAIYDILPAGPDLVVEAAGPIQAVNLMISLLRRGTRWNIFGITTHEEFKLDGGWMHFLEARMDSSFSTTPEAIENAVRLMSRGLVDPGKVISHHFPLSKIHEAIETMSSPERNKVIIHP